MTRCGKCIAFLSSNESFLAIPLIGHILFQYCAYCIGLTSMAIVGPISHVILGMNMNPFNTIYISDSEDTVYIDLRDDGKILTVSQLLQNFSFLAPGMNIEIYRGGLNVDRVIQNELLSSLNASTIFLPILNNLILVHKRATSPSLYHSRKFLVVILTYLNTQILILLSTLSLSTVTSPIPPPLIKPPRNIVWNIRNIAIFEKFFLVTKSLKFKTLFEHRMKDLQHIPDTPKVLLANIFED